MNSQFVILTLTSTLAGCSILYELVMAQTISLLAANTVERYSLTIGLYLGSMGIGAMVVSRIFRKERSWSQLFIVEVLLSLFGAVSVLLINFAQMLSFYHSTSDYSPYYFFVPAFFAIIFVGFFTGFELPLLIYIGNDLNKKKKITNRVLGFDYFGSLIGAVSFPLILLPYLSPIAISFGTAMVNLFAALFILLAHLKGKKGFVFSLLMSMGLIIVIGAGSINLTWFESYFLKKYYFYNDTKESYFSLFRPMPEYPEIDRYSTPYQKIDFFEYPPVDDPYEELLTNAYSSKFTKDPNYPRSKYLFMNGDIQLISDDDEVYHEYLAHIPIILNRNTPENILVLGAGDGLLVRELVKYEGVKKITMVELDKKMVDLARTHPVLKYMNKGALDDPRVHLVVGDAFQFIKNRKEQYDAIYIDFPYPVNYTLSKLFSREFYYLLKERIKDEGYIAIDSPGIATFKFDHQGNMTLDPDSDWYIYASTLKSAGYGTIVPYVANLEHDNEKLYRDFEVAFLLNPGLSRQGLEQEKRHFIWNTQQGFIYLRKEPLKTFSLAYEEPPVELYVLNGKRFFLAFDLLGLYEVKEDDSKTNSIIRPTFPSLSSWYLKLPY